MVLRVFVNVGDQRAVPKPNAGLWVSPGDHSAMLSLLPQASCRGPAFLPHLFWALAGGLGYLCMRVDPPSGQRRISDHQMQVCSDWAWERSRGGGERAPGSLKVLALGKSVTHLGSRQVSG